MTTRRLTLSVGALMLIIHSTSMAQFSNPIKSIRKQVEKGSKAGRGVVRDAIAASPHPGRGAIHSPGYRFYVYNRTANTLRGVVEYKNERNRWTTTRWYANPGKTVFLLKTRNRYVYLAAGTGAGKKPVGATRSNPTRNYPRHRIDLGPYFTNYRYGLR